MSIRVYSRFLDLLFEIDRYQSLQYKRSYHGIGDFELHVNRYINGADTLEKGHLIALNKRNNKVGIILSKEIALDEGGKETENFKLTGYTLDGLMQRRITVPPSHTSHDRKSGSAESVMKHYVYNNFINTESARQMPFLEIADNQSRGEHIKYESRYKTVSDELENISISTGLGWGIFANFNTKKLIFDVIEAKDLTQGNRQGNNPVFFSPEFETIKSQEFIDSDHELRNVGFVGGQGEGVDRKIVKIGDAHGWDRIETFVDARDISDEDEELEEELTDEEVEELLIDRGKKKMSDMETVFTLEAEILTPTKKSVYEYEKDFDLGDRVDVVNKSWNLKMTAPITELLEIYEPGGFRLEATFGRNRPTLISKLKDKFDELEGVEKQEAPERVSVTNLKEAKKYAREQDEHVRKDSEDYTEDYTYPKQEIDDKDESVYQDSTIYTDALMKNAQREIDDTKARIDQAEKDLGEADKKVDKAVEDVERLEKELEDLDLDFEIGGRNLLRNTSSEWETVSWSNWNEYPNGNTSRTSIEVEPNENYIFKVEYRNVNTSDSVNVGVRIFWRLEDGSNVETGNGQVNVPNGESGAASIVAKAPSDARYGIAVLRKYSSGGSGSAEYRYAKLEKGTKATDWSPAPEDIQAEIDKANERINTANKDIKDAQDLIDSVTDEKNGQTVLKGTLITNELIAEDATLTGSFKGANATIDDLTTKNMTAINAIIQSAIIEGTLNAAKATFKQGIFDKATIQDATIKGTLGANDATMLGLTTEQMIAINATIKDATVTGSLNASDAIFQKGRFDEATIIDANIENATITGKMVGVTGTFNGTLATDQDINVGKKVDIAWDGGEESGIFFRNPGQDAYIWIKRTGAGNLEFFNEEGHIVFGGLTSRNAIIADAGISLLESDGVWNSLQFAGQNYIGTQRTDNDSLALYGNRASDAKPFKVRSHSNESSGTYRDDIWVEPNGDFSVTDTLLFGGVSGASRINSVASRLYLQNNGDVSATRFASGTLVPMRASSFNSTSLVSEKQDIEIWDENILEEIRNTNLFSYRLIDEVEDGYDVTKYGFVIGEGYYLPKHVVSRDGEGIDSYSHSSFNTRAIQQLLSIVDYLQSELEELKNGTS